MVYIVTTVHQKVNTYKCNSTERSSWNGDSRSDIQEVTFLLRNPSFTSVFLRTQNCILSQVNCIRSTPSQPTYLNHKLWQMSSALSDFSLKFSRHFSCNHACYKSHPTHLTPCVRFSIIGRRIEVTKLHVLTGLFDLIFLLFFQVQTLFFMSLWINTNLFFGIIQAMSVVLCITWN
jgi:hypothetical protein